VVNRPDWVQGPADRLRTRSDLPSPAYHNDRSRAERPGHQREESRGRLQNLVGTPQFPDFALQLGDPPRVHGRGARTLTTVATWDTKTWREGPSTLVLQDDGNLVLYRNSDGRPIWHTNTWQPGS
jgi:hypothetical protein